ncbi:hypothetical protein [Seonamhaeicola marinus]|nr:hypothetical protein [Seonamhaeicola marinus]
MKHLIYCLGILVLVLTYACSSSSTDDVSDPDPDPDPTGKLTYDDDVKSIISNNCIGCHGATPTNGAPFSLTTYDSVKDRINGIIGRINNASSPMPPSGLMAQGLRDDIQQWKDDGLLEN